MHAWLIEWGLVLLTAWAGYDTRPRYPLTFDDRVRAQEAIERVYYEHRVWPKENPGPKPPFEQMISRAQIEAKVEDYLKKCAALDKFWQRPIQPEQLQAEMDRMAKQTQDPETLKELFAAFDNDPYLIAECLARPVLADRLIHNWYAFDSRFHGNLRRESEAIHARLTPSNFALLGGAWYKRVEIEARDATLPERNPSNTGILRLDKDAFNRAICDYPRENALSPVKESAEAFIILWTEAKTDQSLRGGIIVFPKRPTGQWLDEASRDLLPKVPCTPAEYTLPTVAASQPGSEGHWVASDALNDPLPSDRYGHTVVWTGAEMIVWGGSAQIWRLNTGGRYTPTTDTWMATSTGANCPSGRSGHTAVWTGMEMIVWGGWNGGSLMTGGRYNPETDTWQSTSKGTGCPSARFSHTAVWTGSEMIVWGGAYESEMCWNSGGRYTPDTDTWAATSTMIDCPAARYFHAAVWTGMEMIVWGGADEFGSYLNTGGRYIPGTDTWAATSTGTDCPTGRYWHTAQWTGAEMVVWGGYGGLNLNDGARYEPAKDFWTATSRGTGCPPGRFLHTAVWTGTEMMVWGGFGWDYFNSGSRYAPVTDTWTPISAGERCPSARGLHTAVWTGTEMIVWGGDGGSDLGTGLSTGGRYVPETDFWTPTSLGVLCPPARQAPAAVWTGVEMIVWGGWGGSCLNTGGRFTLATDTWTPTSSDSSCPSPRSSHTAVWTGTEMLVWGGWPQNQTGGRYSVSTDTWTPTSTGTNCPASRYDHTAVWTGSEMIIWGGYGGSNTGGRYSTATDTWTPTSTGSNCPASRSKHTAVWTGTEMIVWGGFWYEGSTGSSFSEKTGGRYSPGTDSWTATSIGVDCPSARHGHTAVWTGTEMIVWGGVCYSEYNHYESSGGRYVPSTDLWRATSIGPGCPTARYMHTAIWTGLEIIVWGGYDGLRLKTGGRYDLYTDGWTATSAGTNCPSGREWHTAIWTGREMIVWGGVGSSFYLNTGGIYRPYSPHERPVEKPE